MEEKTYFVYKYTRGPWGPFNSAEILNPLRLLSVSSTYSKCSISLKHSSALNTHSNDFICRYTERVTVIQCKAGSQFVEGAGYTLYVDTFMMD